MGFFDLFRSTPSNCAVMPDLIWTTHKGRAVGMLKRISEAVEHSPALVVCHFPKTLEEVCGVLEIGGVIVNKIEEPWNASTFADVAKAPNGTATVTLTEWLPSTDALSAVTRVEEPFPVFVPGRHPLRAEDDRLVSFLNSLPRSTSLQFFMCLDDGIMRVFAGDHVKKMLMALGMSEDEAIESDMVTRRIADAQKKLAKMAASNDRADSVESWMELNLKE